jgi:hypothetical protein
LDERQNGFHEDNVGNEVEQDIGRDATDACSDVERSCPPPLRRWIERAESGGYRR